MVEGGISVTCSHELVKQNRIEKVIKSRMKLDEVVAMLQYFQSLLRQLTDYPPRAKQLTVVFVLFIM